MRARSRQIDALRALAAVSVLAYHALYKSVMRDAPGYELTRPFAAHLDVGVPIFFVLSGFLLYGPFVRARLAGAPAPDVEAYGYRRIMRILPAYWTALVLVGLAGATIPGFTALFSAKGIPGYFGLLQIYNPDTAQGGINPAWTLCVEVTFYALLPVWALLMRRLLRPGAVRRELVALGLLFAASAGWKVYALHHADPNGFGLSAAPWLEPLPAYLDQFALGMGLAVLVAAGARPRIPAAVCWAIAVAAYWVLATRIGLDGSVHDRLTPAGYLARHELNALIAVALVAPVALGTLPRRAAWLLELRPLVFVGTISYGLYLYHVPVLVFLAKHGLAFAPVRLVGLTVLLSLLLAYVSYRLVERPGIALGRRLASRARPGTDDAGGRPHPALGEMRSRA